MACKEGITARSILGPGFYSKTEGFTVETGRCEKA